MEIRVLGCYGGMDKSYRMTSFLINDFFAVDAGGVADALSFSEQRKITDVYISHIHLDHIAGLPFLLDNVFGLVDEPIRIYSHAKVITGLKEHILNDVCWPDFSRLPSREHPTVEFIEVPAGRTFKIRELEITPVWVNHLVPNAGIIVTENGKSWVYPSDTSDTEEIWKITDSLDDPRMLFLECSFPNRFQRLADESFHLTPSGVAHQLKKLARQIPTRLYHAKPSYIDEISAELAEIHHPDLDMLEQDKTYAI